MQINETIEMALKTAEHTEQQPEVEATPRDAYFASLSEWTRQMYEWNKFVVFVNSSYSLYLRNHLVIQRSRRIISTARLRAAQHRLEIEAIVLLDGLPRQRLIRRLGGIEMLVAPFWKRAVADIVDRLIIILLQVLMAFVFTSFAHIDLKRPLVRILLLEEDIVFSVSEVAREFVQLSVATICMIMLSKLLACCYEFLFLMHNHGMTPGKYLMNIRVIYVRTLLPVQPRPAPIYIYQVYSDPYYAVVYPAITPTAERILMRVLLKTFIVHCSVPFCLLLLFPRDNRTTYDMMAKTVVVETRSERTMSVGRWEPRRRLR
ncbi:hypothetical protein KR093_006110 [Drosophila rubida]|uniref:RDD domain-containing protein n=1 Tax=Drosophila rubida TaxID=30044 RepID=A0AAD4K7R3_9MUSC|nr:hypothetical protein KR093_006110 [Drosophila rubida]